MLKPQVQHSQSSTALLLLPKPFIHGNAQTHLSLLSKSSFTKTQKRVVGVGYKAANTKAIANVEQNKSTKVKAIVTVNRTVGGFLSNIGIDRGLDDITDLLGRTLLLELVSSELDPKTGLEKPKIKGYAHKKDEKGSEIRYEADLVVPSSFGEVGAIYVENEHHKEMFIKSISIEGFIAGTANFVCNSWVQAKRQGKRLFFTTKSYLPSETPDGLKKLREQELQSLRGNGQGERKKGERIYDYDVYNDLGDPDSDQNLKRPVLGGSELPYPRRCRTGRPRCKTDPKSETRSSSVYVPRDEEFSEVKELTFGAKTLYSVLHALIPSLETTIVDSNLAFPYFTAIDSLFNEGVHLPPLKQNGWKDILPNLVKTLTDDAKDVLTFESPATFDRDRFFWFRDEEFARQTLAGLNPLSIKLITEWPLKSELDPKVYGPAESAITTEMIQQEIGGFMTVEEAIKQKKLFILDYHDLFLPYVSKVRQLENTTLYGSRTVFFLTEDNTLRPLAIELVRPPIDGKPQWKHAFRPSWHSTSVWLWRLAKAHVLAHESGYHQLVSHWLRTHACTEPYIIAANRQLSAIHPIYRLLHPHFRYTMEINALAREALINAGGIIETSFSPGKYCMEMSAVIYDKLWRFDHEALPKDLISRGMAVEDPSAPYGGVRLTISDYPYASDGLILWDSIKSWVADYVNHYYPDSNLVLSDKELQNFWTEVRTVGHGDKKDQPWWPELKTTKDLIEILTTIIWVNSGHHAAVNFGQYTYAGYFPNRPTIARLKMPIEDPTDIDWKFFSEKPEAVLLTTFPSQVQATKVMAVLDVLSNHSPDEEYLGKEIEPAWAEDPDIKAAFEKFSGRLTELEGIVDERNANPELKNRNGAGIVPYELLKPFSESGVTGRGVPNSISI